MKFKGMLLLAFACTAYHVSAQYYLEDEPWLVEAGVAIGAMNALPDKTTATSSW